MTTPDRSLLGVSLGGIAAVALAMALVAVRGENANANVALALVLPIIASAVVGGRLAGATTALIAAMSFDFFHTRPYLSLKITSANDIETTILLLALGLAVGQLAVQAINDRRQRRHHLEAFSRLRRITDLAVRGDIAEDIASGIAAELISELGLRDCWYEPAPFLDGLARLHPNGHIDQRIYRLGIGDDFELPRDGAEIIVTGQHSALGRFVLLPTPGHGVSSEQRLVALALVDQLAIRLVAQPA